MMTACLSEATLYQPLCIPHVLAEPSKRTPDALPFCSWASPLTYATYRDRWMMWCRLSMPWD